MRDRPSTFRFGSARAAISASPSSANSRAGIRPNSSARSAIIAARLEELTKELSCTIILSRAVIERAGFAMPTPESHRVQIKNVSAEIENACAADAKQLDDLISTLG